MRHKKVLVIGSGGREHALAWALSRSPQVQQVYVAPGNAGTIWDGNPAVSGLQPIAPCQNVAIAAHDYPALLAFARNNGIDLTVVGAEQPLADGIVDQFMAAGLLIFGPTQAAAQLEASKAFAKDFMRTHAIPTADYGVFSDYEHALDFVNHFTSERMVIKADGLAAGKGVLICQTQAQAQAALKHIMQDRAFAAAGDVVVIEELLTGREVSVLAFSDGKTVLPMPLGRDYKRSHDGDKGLNTGGMGAFAPTSDVSAEELHDILTTVMQPAIDGMAANGTPYVGVLYAGLMLTEHGLKVLEFNCRFGDPETQVILPLLQTDLYDILSACIQRSLDTLTIDWHRHSCATVVLASGGYPERYQTSLPITGLDALAAREDVIAFHAGTTHRNGQVVTAGGRVMAITAPGATLDAALDRAYEAMALVHFDGMHYRRDIGKAIVERVES